MNTAAPLEPAPLSSSAPTTLDQAIRENLAQYFEMLEGAPASGIYDMVLMAIERPMLDVVMGRAEGNQSAAAKLLGIDRNTLRKKLEKHGMLLA